MTINNTTLVIDAFWADNKPFPTEISENSPAGKILYSEYHGTARHLGWMDLVQLRYLVKKHHIHHLVLKNLDILGKVAYENNGVEVCISYTNSKTFHFIHELSEEETNLRYYSPFYHTAVFGGWKQSSNDTEFHCRAQQYMRYILLHTKNLESVTFANSKVQFTVFYDEQGSPKFETKVITK